MCQQTQGSWYQAGIVSFGIGCAEKDVPAVYADVAFAACWIDQEVGDYTTDIINIDTSTIVRCPTMSWKRSLTSATRRRTVPTMCTAFNDPVLYELK